MNLQRPLAAVARGDETEPARLLVGREELLLVAGAYILGLGQNPDLVEVYGLCVRGVHLAVANARPRGHALPLVRAYDFGLADAVAVAQAARYDVGEYLHVSVAVRSEASAGRDAVFVDDAQVAE